MRKAFVLLIVLALTGAVFIACQDPGSQVDATLGSLKITFDSSADKSVAGAKAISSSVTAVQLKLSSDEFPSVLASAGYPTPGTITVSNVKAGPWTAQVYLNNAAGATLYYGLSAVVVQPGNTTNATIRVYATGGVGVSVTEGVVSPSFTAGSVNTVAGTVSVTISLPSYLTGAKICYRTNGTDPTITDPAYTSPVTVDVTLAGVLKAITLMTADSAVSPVVSYSYSLPLISVYQGATSYTNGSTYPFAAVSPGSSSAPVYITVKNTGTSADLVLSGVKVELAGTAPEQFGYDLADLQTTIGAGQSTRFSLTFSPRTAATFAAIVKIYSNSGVDSAFALNVTGTGNNAPTLSFLTGLDVQAAGTSLSDGLYQSINTSHGYPVYKHLTSNYWIYYEYDSVSGNPYYQRYLLGDSASWVGDGYDQYSGSYVNGHTRMYVKYYGTLSDPTGKSYSDTYDTMNSWYSPFTFGSSPYVSTVNGIGGWLKVGRTLTAYYQYQDNESDAQSGTTFQWYQGTSSSGPWTTISIATSQTYVLQSPEENKYIAVDVTPHAASGAQVGATQRSTTSQAVTP